MERLKSGNLRPGNIVCIALPAFLFAAFMVTGRAFAYDGSLARIFADSEALFWSVVAFFLYFIIFLGGIAILYQLMERFPVCGEMKYALKQNVLIGRYLINLDKHTFATVFMTLLVMYIPYMMISYPAIHMGDTCNQLAQGYNFPEGTSGYLKLIDENVRLNGHHPILHTLYMHFCMVVGDKIFGSYNIGIFLVSMTQALCTISVISYACAVMARAGVKRKLIFFTMLYFILSPRIQNYLFLITKDVFTACALLVLGISIWQIQRKDCTKMAYCFFTVSGMCLALLRNDGKYIVFVCVLCLLLVEHRKWKKILACAAVIMFAVIMLFHVIMPLCRITPASKREALSLPFQQTTRYLRDYGADVTPQEKEAIARVLRYDALVEKYDPENGDYVKETYNEEASAEELEAYFKAWWEMFQKHPGVYLEAAMHNYYNYFYIGDEAAMPYTYEQSAIFMTYVNDALDEIGMSIHYPEWSERYRRKYEELREKLFSIPVLSLFVRSASYVWALILWCFYLLKTKKIRFVLSALPMLLSLGVALMASRNGDYFRYLYGIAFCLPVIVMLGQVSVQECTSEV